MRKSRLKPVALVAFIAAIAIIISASVYAYYRWAPTHNASVSYGTPVNGEIISVSSYEELFAVSKSGDYNDAKLISDMFTATINDTSVYISANRKTISLTDDITLMADLLITADCHINLNGHNIFMNGHSLTLSNTYAGDFLFTGNGGKIIHSSQPEMTAREIIYTETPNGAVTFDGIVCGTLQDDVFTAFSAEDEASHRISLAVDENYVVYNALYEVAAAVADETNRLYPRRTYNEIAIPETLTSSYYIEDTIQYGSVTTVAEPYSLVFSDLDLPYHYNGYGNVTIDYAVTHDGSVLTDKGEVVGTGSVTLTATVTVGNVARSCEFSLLVDNELTTAEKKEYARQMVRNIIGYFYVETDATNQPFQKYVFNRDTVLSTKLSAIPGVEISYYGYNDAGTQLFPKVGEDAPITTDNTVLFTPSSAMTKLRFSINADNSGEDVYPSTTGYYSMTSSNTGLIINGASLANDLLTDWYNNEIRITANYDINNNYLSHTSNELYTALRDPIDLVYENYFSNLEVVYSLSNDTEGNYEIVNGTGTNKLLRVVSGKHPENDAQRVLLKVSMSMTYDGAPYSISIDIPISCYRNNSSDTNIEMFMPYYCLYDRNFVNMTGALTENSFTMPFSDGISVPFMIYDYVVSSHDITVAQEAMNALSLKLIYDNETYTVARPALNDVTKYKAIVQGYLSAFDQREIDITSAEWHIVPNGTPSWIAYDADENWASTITVPTMTQEDGYYSAPLHQGDIRCFVFSPGATISLYFGGEEHVLAPSYTNMFTAGGLTATKDSDGTSATLTIAQLLAAGNTMWQITIDKAALPVENTTVDLVYAFKMENSAESWSYYHTFSRFTLRGIVHNAVGEIADAGFYEWVYLKYNSSGDSVYDATTDYILTDWLGQSNTIDVTEDTSLAAINDFRGIRYLKGVTSLNLSGKQCSNIVGELQYLTGLNMLKLSGCSLNYNNTADYTDFYALSALTNLTVLYIDDNSIYNFLWLSDIPNLSHVYLYSNTPPTTQVQVFYGSDGLTNYSAFHSLKKDGVLVYNTLSNGNPNIFLDSNITSTTYLNLIGVTYQDKIPIGSSIANVYANLSTTPSDYGISTTVKNSSGATVTATSVAISFGYDGDATTATEFRMTLAVTYGGNVYNIVVYYRVSRV